jgi:hypothetical protein
MGWLTRYFNKPVDGREHRLKREELWIGGDCIACMYYLGMMRNKDYSDLTLEDLDNDIIEFIIQYASPNASVFAHSKMDIDCIALPFLKQRFHLVFDIDLKLTKEEKGVILLLKNPDWTDEQIRLALKTTEKQMSHWLRYRRARAIQAL